MKIETKIIRLSSGVLTLRAPEPEDAEEILKATVKMAGETKFLSGTPETRNIPLEREMEWVDRKNESESEYIIAAYYKSTNYITRDVPEVYVGNLELRLNTGERQRHRAGVGIALLQKYTHLGIGSQMFRYAKEIAKKHNVEMLELDVISTNLPAINCYVKQGFEITGNKKKFLKYEDGTYGNMYHMQCEL